MTTSTKLKRVSVQSLAIAALSGLALGASATTMDSFTTGEKARSLVQTEHLQASREASEQPQKVFARGAESGLPRHATQAEQPFEGYTRVPHAGYVKAGTGQV